MTRSPRQGYQVGRIVRALRDLVLATATILGFLTSALAGPDPGRWLWLAGGCVACGWLVIMLGGRLWRVAKRVVGLWRELAVKDHKIRELTTQLRRAIDEQEAWVLEGQRQAVGEILAREADVPTLHGITKRNAAVALVARGGPAGCALPGARYFLVEQVDNTVRGVVEIAAEAGAECHGPDRQLILRPVEKRSPRFWEHLTGRVDIDTSPPPHLILRPYRLDAETDGDDRLVERGPA